MSVPPPCCVSGFAWEGTPEGQVGRLGSNQAYVTGDADAELGILLVHDLLGWTFPNVRLLADHYAREARAAVYVPDFFGGEVLPFAPLLAGRWHELDVPAFVGRNSRDVREPEIVACARSMREAHARVGAVGFCFGGWAVFRLGASEHQPPLVDFVTAGHPSLLIKGDIDEVAVPVQVLAPEIDPVYTAELKLHTFETLQKRGVPFDYQHFPGVEHACFVRGSKDLAGEREAMARGAAAVVAWAGQHSRAS